MRLATDTSYTTPPDWAWWKWVLVMLVILAVIALLLWSWTRGPPYGF